MKLTLVPIRSAFILALMAHFLTAAAHADVRLEVIEFSSRVLKDNPLRDPVVRRVAVFVPEQITNQSALPIVYYLPGYGNSSDAFIKNAAKWRALTGKIAAEVAPVLLVVVDGRNRWGGSQYLNSPAQGNYADYVCDEIVGLVESRHGLSTHKPQRLIAGHSSGGFGALRLGMLRPKLFAGVIALSPDSDFASSHRPLVQLPGVTNATLTQIKSFMAAELRTPAPSDGDLTYTLGLSAAYAPVGRWFPGEFEWLYTADGRFREKVWRRWMANDPLTLVQQRQNAFLPDQSVYLEGAAQDEYGANIGARKIYEAIHNRPARSTFYEPPGKHSDHLPERIQRGIAWVLERPIAEIR